MGKAHEDRPDGDDRKDPPSPARQLVAFLLIMLCGAGIGFVIFRVLLPGLESGTFALPSGFRLFITILAATVTTSVVGWLARSVRDGRMESGLLLEQMTFGVIGGILFGLAWVWGWDALRRFLQSCQQLGTSIGRLMFCLAPGIAAAILVALTGGLALLVNHKVWKRPLPSRRNALWWVLTLLFMPLAIAALLWLVLPWNY